MLKKLFGFLVAAIYQGKDKSKSPDRHDASMTPKRGTQRSSHKLEELFPFKVLIIGKYLWPGWPDTMPEDKKARKATLQSISDTLQIS